MAPLAKQRSLPFPSPGHSFLPHPSMLTSSTGSAVRLGCPGSWGSFPSLRYFPTSSRADRSRELLPLESDSPGTERCSALRPFNTPSRGWGSLMSQWSLATIMSHVTEDPDTTRLCHKGPRAGGRGLGVSLRALPGHRGSTLPLAVTPRGSEPGNKSDLLSIIYKGRKRNSSQSKEL